MKIFYLAYYSLSKNDNRYFSLSSKAKIDYISSKLISKGFTVEIVSPSWSTNKKGFLKGKYQEISKSLFLKQFNSFGSNSKIFNFLKYFYSLFNSFFYLLFNLKNNDKLIVYHSISFYFLIFFLKIFKKTKIILEVEEIYHKAQKIRKSLISRENKIFSFSDGFIFSNDLLNEQINKKKKPFLILYGVYNKQKITKQKNSDGDIHIVYSGTFDFVKGGAENSIKILPYLAKNYHLHVLGFGNAEDTLKIVSLIDDYKKSFSVKISYHEKLEGDNYNNFLQQCHIGLSTQYLEGAFNESSFPSKVLSYMNNGLIVVAGNIKVLKESLLCDYIHFYNEDSPQKIAKIISNIDISNSKDPYQVLRYLDDKFVLSLDSFISNIKE
jgi:hypothetical protein